MGYLSTYFINYFKQLDPETNYIVAPQAPSKYYQGSDFKHVGASWLTRVDTVAETENVLAYVDAVVVERPWVRALQWAPALLLLAAAGAGYRNYSKEQ